MNEITCAATARARGEPLLGTASRVRGWLLLQQQGPWGADALIQSRLHPAFARALAERAQRAGVRVLLLRRPGRGASELRPRCYLAYTGPRTHFIEGRRLERFEDVLTADLARLRKGERPGFGDIVEHPLYLVCTNGKHDQCCAIYGLPLAQSLAARYGDRVWECSHVGGDRFAGNLVCFPHGLYYGAVEPADGPRLVDAYERGLIDLAHFRGRASADPAVQAAEHFVRQREGLLHVDDLVVERREVRAGGEVEVRFSTPTGTLYRARIHVGRAAEAWRLTCRAERALHPPVYRLIALQAEYGAGKP